MKKIKLFVLIGLMALSFAGLTAPAFASSQSSVCEGIGAVGGTENCSEEVDGITVSSLVRTVVRILSIVIGAVAVIMLFIGGLKYITSGGESAKVGSAKNTILYAVIGLIIAVFAQLIIRFVITEVTTTPSTPSAPTAPSGEGGNCNGIC